MEISSHVKDLVMVMVPCPFKKDFFPAGNSELRAELQFIKNNGGLESDPGC